MIPPVVRAGSPEGVLRFNLELSVDTDEMRHWPPLCVKAFFDGIARAQEATNFAREAIAKRGAP